MDDSACETNPANEFHYTSYGQGLLSAVMGCARHVLPKCMHLNMFAPLGLRTVQSEYHEAPTMCISKLHRCSGACLLFVHTSSYCSISQLCTHCEHWIFPAVLLVIHSALLMHSCVVYWIPSHLIPSCCVCGGGGGGGGGHSVPNPIYSSSMIVFHSCGILLGHTTVCATALLWLPENVGCGVWTVIHSMPVYTVTAEGVLFHARVRMHTPHPVLVPCCMVSYIWWISDMGVTVSMIV